MLFGSFIFGLGMFCGVCVVCGCGMSFVLCCVKGWLCCGGCCCEWVLIGGVSGDFGVVVGGFVVCI